MRKTSLDLRREIIEVGGIQNLIQLRKKRKQKKRAALVAQEPPPEPEEIVSSWEGPCVGRGPGRPGHCGRPWVTAFPPPRLARWRRRHS